MKSEKEIKSVIDYIAEKEDELGIFMPHKDFYVGVRKALNWVIE